MADRKPMLSEEELAFVKGNGFQKPQADTKPIESPPVEKDTTAPITIDSLIKEKEKTTRFTVDLPKSLHKKLRVMAAEKGLKMTDLARMAIANTLAQLEEDDEDE